MDFTGAGNPVGRQPLLPPPPGHHPRLSLRLHPRNQRLLLREHLLRQHPHPVVATGQPPPFDVRDITVGDVLGICGVVVLKAYGTIALLKWLKDRLWILGQ